MTLDDVNQSIDALMEAEGSTTLSTTLTDKMAALFAALDATELRKAIERAAETKTEIAAAVAAKAARARELSQESLSKGQELASGFVNKARPLATIALERGAQLANQLEPRVASAYAATKESAARVGSYVYAMRTSSD